MEKSEKLEKFLTLVSDEKTELLEKIEWRRANRKWLEKSGKIAFKILRILRKNKEENKFPSSQKELAELVNMKPQQINTILKGNENLTLETISRIEVALGVQIMELTTESYEPTFEHELMIESILA
jgi:ribosome-binding protein aMBF1 (putative translation factor)